MIAFMISIMKAIICKYRVLLECESTSYELRAKECIVKCACGQEEVAMPVESLAVMPIS